MLLEIGGKGSLLFRGRILITWVPTVIWKIENVLIQLGILAEDIFWVEL